TKPFQLDQVQLQPGQVLLLSPYIVGRDSRYFPEPDVFSPKRWLDDAWVRSLPKGVFFPFGGGPRGCPGRHLAITELITTVATIARLVHFERSNPSQTMAKPGRTLIPAGLQLTVRIK